MVTVDLPEVRCCFVRDEGGFLAEAREAKGALSGTESFPLPRSGRCLYVYESVTNNGDCCFFLPLVSCKPHSVLSS